MRIREKHTVASALLAAGLVYGFVLTAVVGQVLWSQGVAGQLAELRESGQTLEVATRPHESYLSGSAESFEREGLQDAVFSPGKGLDEDAYVEPDAMSPCPAAMVNCPAAGLRSCSVRCQCEP